MFNEINMWYLAYRWRTKYLLSAKSSFIRGSKEVQNNKILLLINDESRWLITYLYKDNFSL